MSPHSESPTILVVDDEPTIRMLIAETLGDLGYDCLEAADGAVGLDLLRSHARIGLLITDVGLPGDLDGHQLAAAARADRPGLKVLFVTGYGNPPKPETADPATRSLPKPFDLDELADMVRALLARPAA